MKRTIRRKGQLVSIRLPASDIAIIERAASLRGCSRTGFVREAAVRAAEDVLVEATPIRLSSDSFKAFVDMLSKPTAPSAEMTKLLGRKAPWER
jgi:uncharacterized protein (DUF1778 family)